MIRTACPYQGQVETPMHPLERVDPLVDVRGGIVREHLEPVEARHDLDLPILRAAIHRKGERALFDDRRSEEHTSELQSLMRISYAVFCLKKKKTQTPRLYSHI